MKINSKFLIPESGFISKLHTLIKEYDAINLAEGHTGFRCSPKLIELVEQHLSEGLNSYTHSAGNVLFRSKIADKVNYLYDKYYSPEKEITITAGVTQAIYTSIAALVKEDDEVIVVEPSNEYYVPAIEMNGGRPVVVTMKGPQYHIDWEDVQRKITSKTRMLIFNSPHAQTGWVLSEIDMIRLQKVITGTKIIILSEETFEHVVFDGQVHQSMAYFPKLAERSIIVSSLGETYNVASWQLGYCLAPEEISTEIRKAHKTMVYSVNSPFQMAMADFLENKDEYKKLSALYQKKRDTFMDLMSNTRFKPLNCSGTFFQLYDYSAISEEKDRDFVTRLIKDYGVASMPISTFMQERHAPHHIRFNFARPDEELEEAAKRLSGV